jgi:hypothetical protein
MPTMLTWRAGIIAGVIGAVCYSASPLFTLTLAGCALVMLNAGKGLPPHESRLLALWVASALAVRFLYIGVMLVSDIPLLNDLSVGGLRGDDAYYLSRAIRARDISLGVTQGRYDFFVITDEYGRTGYLHLLTALQVLFGPTPYGMRAVNALLFVAAAVILFRLVRPGFGATSSFAALVVLLFLPSLFVSSVSLLKESVYLLVASLLLLSVTVARRSNMATAVGYAAVAAVCVFVLHDLRRGALALVIAGLAIGLAIPVVFATRRRALASIAALSLAIAVASIQPPLRARALDAVTAVAKTHAGHVYTSGHSYKLLDEGFYVTTAWPERLTDAQALRFLVRAAVSFVVTPLPWEMASLSELAFFPELVVWWLIVIFAPIGIIVGWQRDRHITALLLGFALPTAAALAVTNGNVGTLLRLRGLVTPYIVWLAVLGALAVAEYLVRARPAPALAAEQGR